MRSLKGERQADIGSNCLVINVLKATPHAQNEDIGTAMKKEERRSRLHVYKVRGKKDEEERKGCESI